MWRKENRRAGWDTEVLEPPAEVSLLVLRQRREGSRSHLGSLGCGLRAKGGVEFGRSADALIKPRVRFPAQLSTNAAVRARNEYSQSANRRKCFTKTEPEGVKGKQALFTRRQTAAAVQHSPEEAEM